MSCMPEMLVARGQTAKRLPIQVPKGILPPHTFYLVGEYCMSINTGIVLSDLEDASCHWVDALLS